MATTVIGKLELDVSAVLANLRKIVEESIRTGADTAKAFASATASLAKSFTDAAGGAKTAIDTQRNALAALTVAGKAGSDEYVRLVRETKAVVDEQKKLDAALKDVDRTIGNIAKTGPQLGGLFQFNQITSAVQQVTGAFNTFLGPYKEFDKQLKNIGTLGVKNFEEFRSAAIELAAGVPDTVATVTAGIYDAISAGAIQVVNGQADVAGGLKFVEQAAKLAVAGITDTQSAVKSLASVTNAYSASGLDAARASDVLFSTVNAGVTTIPELNASLSNVIGVAAAAKVPFEQVGAAIATLTKQGVPTAQATTQIRAAISELLKPGKELAVVMQQAGVTTESLANEGLQETFRKLGAAMSEAGVSAATTFSRIESIQFALATTGDNAVKAAADLKAIQDGAGSTQKAFEIANTGIGVIVQGVLNQIEAVAFKAFGAIGDGAVIALDAANRIAPLVSTFAGLGSLIPDGAFTKTAELAKSTFGSVRSFALSAFTTVAADGTRAFAGFSGTLSNLAGGIRNVATSILRTLVPSFASSAAAAATASASTAATAAATTATGVAAGATGSAFAAMWASVIAPALPVIAAIAAVGAAVYLLYENVEPVREAIDSVIEVAKELAVGLFETWKSIGGVLLEVGRIVLDYLIAPFQVAYEIISGVFSTVFDVINDAFGNAGAAAEEGGSGIADAFGSVIDVIDGVGRYIAGLRATFNEWKDVAIQAVRSAVEYIRPAIQSVVAAFIFVYNAVRQVATFLGGVYLSIVKTAGGVIIDVLVAAFRTLYSVVVSVAEFVGGALTSAFNAVVGAFQGVATALRDILLPVFSAIRSALSDALDALIDFVQGIPGVRAVISGVSTAVNVLSQGFRRAGDAITFVKGLIGGLSEALSVVGDAAAKFFQGIKNVSLTEIEAALSGIPGKVKDAFSAGFNTAVDNAKVEEIAGKLNEALQKSGAEAFSTIQKAITELSKQQASLSEADLDKQKKSIFDQIESVRKLGTISKEQAEQLVAALTAIQSATADTAQDLGAIARAQAEALIAESDELTNAQIKARIAVVRKALDSARAVGQLEQAEYKKLSDDIAALLKRTANAAAQEADKLAKSQEEFRKLERGAATQAIDEELERQRQALEDQRQDALAAARQKAADARVEQERLNAVLLNINADYDRRLEKLFDDANKKRLGEERKQAEERLKIELDGYKAAIDAIAATNESAINRRTELQLQALAAQQELELESAAGNVANSLAILIKFEQQRRTIVAASDLAIRRARAEAIEDDAERELALARITAEEKLRKELQQAGADRAARINAIDEYNRSLRQVETASQARLESSFGVVASKFRDVATELAGAFRDLRIDIDTAGAERAREDIAAITEEQRRLSEEQRSGARTFQEVTAAQAELNRRRADALTRLRDAQGDLLSSFARAAAAAFARITDIFRTEQEKQTQALAQADERRRSLMESQARFREQMALAQAARDAALAAGDQDRVQESQALVDELQQNIDDAAKGIADAADAQSSALSRMFAVTLATAGSAFAEMALQGENVGKAFLKSAFDVLQSMIPIWSAQILGGSLATPQSILSGGAAGIAQWAALTALISSAVAAAKASLGFEKGGYTGDGGVKQVAGVVHGKEFVSTAATTAKHRGLLEHIHKGGNPADFVLKTVSAAEVLKHLPMTQVMDSLPRLSAAAALELVPLQDILKTTEAQRAIDSITTERARALIEASRSEMPLPPQGYSVALHSRLQEAATAHAQHRAARMDAIVRKTEASRNEAAQESVVEELKLIHQRLNAMQKMHDEHYKTLAHWRDADEWKDKRQRSGGSQSGPRRHDAPEKTHRKSIGR